MKGRHARERVQHTLQSAQQAETSAPCSSRHSIKLNALSGKHHGRRTWSRLSKLEEGRQRCTVLEKLQEEVLHALWHSNSKFDCNCSQEIPEGTWMRWSPQDLSHGCGGHGQLENAYQKVFELRAVIGAERQRRHTAASQPP